MNPYNAVLGNSNSDLIYGLFPQAGAMLRLVASLLVLFLACALPGCAPYVVCTVETEVAPDYTVRRVTRMESHANPNYPNQRHRLGEFFQFPPAELYDSYTVQPNRVQFAGTFDSFDRIPNDLVRATPGTTALAGNLFSYRVMDLVLVVLADFDETLTDIVVSEEDGTAALDELLRLMVPEIMAVLNAKYGARFDLSRLDSYLNHELPQKLRRIYLGAWNIHRSTRSGVSSPGEEYEYYLFLKAEAKREGLELVEYGTPNMKEENIRRLREWGIRLAQSLCPPRQGMPGATQEMLSGTAMEELIASMQNAITARHGSINNYVGKIAALVPRAYGAYLTGTMMPIYMLPESTYYYRLRLPGHVIQTNGVREVNGDLVWTFADRDLAFTGQSMWARTMYVRQPLAYGLGLRGFPASLSDVDKLFGYCLNEAGGPREELLKTFRQAATARSLGPLEAMANNPSSPDAQAARGLLSLFENHRRTQPAASSGAAAAPDQPATGAPQQPAPQPQPGAGASARIEPPPLPPMAR